VAHRRGKLAQVAACLAAMLSGDDGSGLRADERKRLVDKIERLRHSGEPLPLLRDDRSGVSASGEVEGYVRGRDLAELCADYLLSDVGAANVRFGCCRRLTHSQITPSLRIGAGTIGRGQSRRATKLDRRCQS
jgi:hypothetical protein